jgi:hypothetical protein
VVDTPTPAIPHFRFSIFTGIKKSGKYFGSSDTAKNIKSCEADSKSANYIPVAHEI